MDTRITLNWVDVKMAMKAVFWLPKRSLGERYILANEQKSDHYGYPTVLAGKLYPELQLKKPCCRSKIYAVHFLGDYGILRKLNGKPPVLTIKILLCSQACSKIFDISKARNELGFNPKNQNKF